MNRSERRRAEKKAAKGAPIVVKLPDERKIRTRKMSRQIADAVAAISIEPIKAPTPFDMAFVAKLIHEHTKRTGAPPTMLNPTAPVLMARRRITNEPLGFLSVFTVPPGKVYVENMLVIPGRWGRLAARALIERLMQLGPKKVCVIEATNAPMLAIAEHYAGRVVGFIVEGPFTGEVAEVPISAGSDAGEPNGLEVAAGADRGDDRPECHEQTKSGGPAERPEPGDHDRSTGAAGRSLAAAELSTVEP